VRAIIQNAGKLRQRPPKPGFRNDFICPWRWWNRASSRAKHAFRSTLRWSAKRRNARNSAVRVHTRCFLEETAGKALRKYHMPHPFLGTLHLGAWLPKIASHQIRHTKQMREIAANLPKTVTTLHK